MANETEMEWETHVLYMYTINTVLLLITFVVQFSLQICTFVRTSTHTRASNGIALTFSHDCSSFAMFILQKRCTSICTAHTNEKNKQTKQKQVNTIVPEMVDNVIYVSCCHRRKCLTNIYIYAYLATASHWRVATYCCCIYN